MAYQNGITPSCRFLLTQGLTEAAHASRFSYLQYPDENLMTIPANQVTEEVEQEGFDDLGSLFS